MATSRSGFTLLELLICASVMTTIGAIAVPRFSGLQHRLAVRGASSLLTRALLDARHHAARRGTRIAVRFDTTAATVTVSAPSDTLARHDLHTLFGVSLAVTRDSIAYLPSGLGYGASNARFIVSRGTAADTVTVSRIGRVRR